MFNLKSTSLSLPFRTVKNFNIKISVLEIIGPLKFSLEIQKLGYLCLVKRGNIYMKPYIYIHIYEASFRL